MRAPADAVDATIHHAQVKRGESAAQVFDAIDEQGVVNFIDVIFVQQNLVQAGKRVLPPDRKARAA